MFEARRWFWRLRSFFYSASAAWKLAAVLVFVFIAQTVSGQVPFISGFSFGTLMKYLFGLSGGLLLKGFFWQPVTFLFLHAGWLHLVMNLFGLLVFGIPVERSVGARRMVTLFLVGGLLGGLFWLGAAALMPLIPRMNLLTAWIPPEAAELIGKWFGIMVAVPPVPFRQAMCIGASGGVFALMGAFTALDPDRELYALIAFLPIRMRMRTLAIVFLASGLLDALFIQSQIANSVHLAGGLTGYFLARFWCRSQVS